ncbi:MAG TPA: hypothetical protein VGO48_09160 [Conexibacter sp.]|jgi:hypothetical protein|nr:hypothetical protein [Conexibacter sp.]
MTTQQQQDPEDLVGLAAYGMPPTIVGYVLDDMSPADRVTFGNLLGAPPNGPGDRPLSRMESRRVVKDAGFRGRFELNIADARDVKLHLFESGGAEIAWKSDRPSSFDMNATQKKCVLSAGPIAGTCTADEPRGR